MRDSVLERISKKDTECFQKEDVPHKQTSFTKQDNYAKTSTAKPNIQYYLLLPFKRLEKNGPWKWNKERTAPGDLELLLEKEKSGKKKYLFK